MCVESVQNVKRRVRYDFHCAFAGCYKEVEVGGYGRGYVVGKGGRVSLDGLGTSVESCIGCSAFS